MQVATSIEVVSKIGEEIGTDAAVLASIAKFALEAVRSEAAKAARELVAAAQTSPSRSDSDSSSDTEKKDLKKKSSRNKHRIQLASFVLSSKGT